MVYSDAVLAGSDNAGMNAFAGLDLNRPRIMGIVNVTPDSFSDGGEALRLEDAVRQARNMRSAGADIIDIGGESTRPGAVPISVDEECGRVIPVIEALSQENFLISIDSRRSRVMEEAITSGAGIVNDISALSCDPNSILVIAKTKVPVILTHMQGQPPDMQDNPIYDVPSLDILDYLRGRIAACKTAGIPSGQIAVDPGIGFGKSLGHNLEILANISVLRQLGCPIVLGASRKSFIGSLSNMVGTHNRLAGSIATALSVRAQGVQIFRVHDVAETRQAFDVWEAIDKARN